MEFILREHCQDTVNDVSDTSVKPKWDFYHKHLTAEPTGKATMKLYIEFLGMCCGWNLTLLEMDQYNQIKHLLNEKGEIEMVNKDNDKVRQFINFEENLRRCKAERTLLISDLFCSRLYIDEIKDEIDFNSVPKKVETLSIKDFPEVQGVSPKTHVGCLFAWCESNSGSWWSWDEVEDGFDVNKLTVNMLRLDNLVHKKNFMVVTGMEYDGIPCTSSSIQGDGSEYLRVLLHPLG